MKKHIDQFLSCLEIERNYSKHTIINYRIDLIEFAAFLGSGALENVAYPDLRRFLALLKARQLKPRTLARKLSSLRSFFKYLQREKIVKDNPAALLVTPKLDKPLPHFLSEEEAVKIIEAPKQDKVSQLRDKSIFEILYSTGIRVSELVGLDVKDVDFISNIVRVMGKGKRSAWSQLATRH
jgi:integrase/recombinase XerC